MTQDELNVEIRRLYESYGIKDELTLNKLLNTEDKTFNQEEKDNKIIVDTSLKLAKMEKEYNNSMANNITNYHMELNKGILDKGLDAVMYKKDNCAYQEQNRKRNLDIKPSIKFKDILSKDDFIAAVGALFSTSDTLDESKKVSHLSEENLYMVKDFKVGKNEIYIKTSNDEYFTIKFVKNKERPKDF